MRAFHPTHFCCGLVACARKLLIFADTVVARGTPWVDQPVTDLWLLRGLRWFTGSQGRTGPHHDQYAFARANLLVSGLT